MENTKSFRQYAVVKQQIADLIRSARQVFERRKAESWADACQALQARLAADRFNLVVLGQFKRGKSSLINAIIGRELLPTGVLPLTSAITTLRYGPHERVALVREGWVFEQEIPLVELPDYVTEQGNPGNEKRLIEARIELPVPFLRRGVYFVDTPGVGSSRVENTATTYRFLPEADAVIFVTSADGPLSETEQNFLHDIAADVRKLFLVVNKMDLVSPQDREAVLAYVRTQADGILGAENITLFALSARQALIATSPAERLASGIGDLEAELETFLVEEKTRAFSISILDRFIDITSSARQDRRVEDLWPQIARIQVVAIELRDALLGDEQQLQRVLSAVKIGPEALVAAPTAPDGRKLPPPSPRTRTCPICAAIREELFNYFVDLQQTGAPEQSEFLHRGGLCQVHSWQFREMAAAVTINQLYARLAEASASQLRELRSASGPGEVRILPEQRACPACELIHRTEDKQIAKFLEGLRRPEGRAALKNTFGPCMPHLQAMLEKQVAPQTDPQSGVTRFLLDQQTNHLEELSEDMRNYVLKREALRRDLLNSNEENAWSRALVQLVGERMSYRSSSRSE